MHDILVVVKFDRNCASIDTCFQVWFNFLLQIEYLPISSVEKVKPIMEEFIEIWRDVLSKKSLPGQFLRTEPIFAEYGLTDHYTWQHTAVQYAAALAQLIASVQVRNS
jgi:mediator of RNA polymerase II transcription subunit 20